VSNPQSEDYGHYLTTHEIGAMISPPRMRVVRIMDWIRSVGVAEEAMKLSLHQDLLIVRLNAAQASILFNADLSVYAHSETGRSVMRTSRYSVTQIKVNVIYFVGGLKRFTNTHPTTLLPRTALQSDLKIENVPKILKEDMERRNKDFLRHRARMSMIDLPKDLIQPFDFSKDLFQSSNWYPKQSSLVNGDTWLLGDFLILCSDGTPAYPLANVPNQLFCKSQNFNTKVNVEMHLMINSISFNSTVSVQNCAQYDLSSTTNLVSLNRAKLLKAMNIPINADPSQNPFFCAIQMNNLPNFQTIDVYIRSIWSTDSTFPFPSPYGVSAAQLSTLWTADSLKKFYGIPKSLTNTNPQNSQSVAEFLGEYYSEKDLQRWLSFMDVTSNSQVKVIGPNDESKPGGEATLDIQWMVGISPDVKTVFWSLGDLHEGQEPFLEWLTDISNTPNAPLVHSVSYADEESTLSQDYMNRVNIELQKAGVRGLTMLFASGDDGVLGYTSRGVSWSVCQSNAFQPQFPSSSPYATSVGGTVQRPNGQEAVATSQGAAARITSGGGFSNVFPAPSYQKTVVAQYLGFFNNVPQSKFQASNRAFPDIAGMAHNYVCLLDGAYIPIDGTSASTPLLASIITLINDRLLTLGKPPIGFFNPLLYQLYAQKPSILRDVTSGNNGCTASASCCVNGFNAAVGWDPATGLGTPNFPSLYAMITGVQP
jgi:subtilase family serine protease